MQNTPTVFIKACPSHFLGHLVAVRTGGLGGTEEEQEHIQDTLMCGNCWRQDRQGLERAMEAMGFSDQDITIVRSHAMQES